jgi:predicted transcriptional regulator
MSVMPDKETFFCFAKTLSKGDAGYHVTPSVHAIGLGCAVSQANKLVYADGWDLTTQSNAVPIGVTCRLCERNDCAQRAMPSVGHPMRIDEDIRAAAFYAASD